MAKTEVYAWRMSPELKMALEDAARRQSVKVSALLERVIRAWLDERANARGTEEQERIRARALRCAGVLSGRDGKRSGQVRQRVRERLAARRARRGRR